jgi:hypothetical protein
MKWSVARVALAVLPLPLAAGCADDLNAPYTTREMMDQGIMYIMPGIRVRRIFPRLSRRP